MQAHGHHARYLEPSEGYDAHPHPHPRQCVPSQSPKFLCRGSFTGLCFLPGLESVTPEKMKKSRRLEARRSGLMSKSCPSQVHTTSWKLCYSNGKIQVIIVSFSKWLQGSNTTVQITQRQNRLGTKSRLRPTFTSWTCHSQAPQDHGHILQPSCASFVSSVKWV